MPLTLANLEHWPFSALSALARANNVSASAHAGRIFGFYRGFHIATGDSARAVFLEILLEMRDADALRLGDLTHP